MDATRCLLTVQLGTFDVIPFYLTAAQAHTTPALSFVSLSGFCLLLLFPSSLSTPTLSSSSFHLFPYGCIYHILSLSFQADCGKHEKLSSDGCGTPAPVRSLREEQTKPWLNRFDLQFHPNWINFSRNGTNFPGHCIGRGNPLYWAYAI